MNIKHGLLGMLSTFLGWSAATAGDMGPLISSQEMRPMISLQGGYASINAGSNFQSFVGTDSDVFTYTNTGSGKNTGFIGVFIGAERALPWISYPGFFMQAGVEYNDFGNLSVKGINTVGVQPQTSTTYNYSYNFQTQQVLGTLKLFATTHERFYPYGEVGLGAAFNHMGQYAATTTETGSINLTPMFRNQSVTEFSYTLGVGVDTQVTTKIRAGLGYRYSNFGTPSSNNGTVIFNNYQSPVAFALGGSNAYANQLIARISYVA